jgi:hypothetical protein
LQEIDGLQEPERVADPMLNYGELALFRRAILLYAGPLAARPARMAKMLLARLGRVAVSAAAVRGQME